MLSRLGYNKPNSTVDPPNSGYWNSLWLINSKYILHLYCKQYRHQQQLPYKWPWRSRRSASDSVRLSCNIAELVLTHRCSKAGRICKRWKAAICQQQAEWLTAKYTFNQLQLRSRLISFNILLISRLYDVSCIVKDAISRTLDALARRLASHTLL